MVDRIYTQKDYDKVTALYNDYQAKKDSYTPEQQQRIEDAFWRARAEVSNKIEESNNRSYNFIDPSVLQDAQVNWLTREQLDAKWWPWTADMVGVTKTSAKQSAPRIQASDVPAAPVEYIPPKRWDDRDFNNYVWPVANHVTSETYPAWTMMSDWTVVPASFDASAYPVGSAMWWWVMMSNWTVYKWAYPVWTAAWTRLVNDWTLMSDWTIVPASFDPTKPYKRKW